MDWCVAVGGLAITAQTSSKTASAAATLAMTVVELSGAGFVLWQLKVEKIFHHFCRPLALYFLHRIANTHPIHSATLGWSLFRVRHHCPNIIEINDQDFQLAVFKKSPNHNK